MSNTNDSQKLDASTDSKKYSPGEGIRSLRTTTLFKVVNYELYAKPNIVIMGIGLICFGGTLAYISYMRWKYEKLGYYEAIKDDGTSTFTKRQSRWSD